MYFRLSFGENVFQEGCVYLRFSIFLRKDRVLC